MLRVRAEGRANADSGSGGHGVEYGGRRMTLNKGQIK